LTRGSNDGYVDRFGNEWTWDHLHNDHWDVQLSVTGKAQLGWVSRDGDKAHSNVSRDGRIIH
jgi:filamentous hemagglutinin